MSLEISELFGSYGMCVKNHKRIRNGILLDTDKGYMLFKEYNKAACLLPRLKALGEEIMANGYENIDTFVETDDNELFVEYDDKKYVMMKYFDGTECDINDEEQVLRGVCELGRLHKALRNINGEKYDLKELCPETLFDKRLIELKRGYSFVRRKKLKNEFELMLGNNLPVFLEDGYRAKELISSLECKKLLENKYVCHGDYNYHNVLFDTDFKGIIAWDNTFVACQCMDLYNYMRKIMEKCGYNLEIGLKMYDTYIDVSQADVGIARIIAALFIFPEKLWKVVNVYFNSKKTNVFKKNMDKLSLCIAQRESKLRFATRLLQR